MKQLVLRVHIRKEDSIQTHSNLPAAGTLWPSFSNPLAITAGSSAGETSVRDRLIYYYKETY